jgi:hypothetical protein
MPLFNSTAGEFLKKTFILLLLILILAYGAVDAWADNQSSTSHSSSSGGAGGLGGAGGTGIGNGGTGGNGFGGEAHGGAGGIGQGGAASNAGNNQSSSMHFEQIRQSPAVFMSAPMPTAVCQATAGGFLSFIAGAGFAASFTLSACEVREEARSLVGMGRPDLALKVMCRNAQYTSQLDECK